MNILVLILLVLVAAGIAVFLYSVVRFNIKRRHVAACAAAADDGALEEIYSLIDGLGDTGPNVFFLGKTNRAAPDQSNRVAVPDRLDDFPWSGQAFQIDVDDDIVCHPIDQAVPEARFIGKVYRTVAVPRSVTKTGKQRNAFVPEKYLSASDDLRRSLARICPEYPQELLAYLVCSGDHGFEFEPCMQARIGASLAWVQSPEFPSCDQCGRRMTFILQVPGTMLHPKRFHEGVFYLFGCKRHPEETKSVVQFF